MPNPYVNKVVKGNTTLIDLTSDTVTAATLLQGYTAHDASGAQITGSIAPSQDSVFVVTVSYNQQDDMWEPDCTYAQVSAAYTAGKEITVQTDSDEGVADGYWVAEGNNHLVYSVYDWYWNESLGLTGSRGRLYILSSSGLDVDEEWFNYEPSGTLNVTQSGTLDVAKYASASVAAGSATASATKGTVSNHSVSVTPSVTRTAGWVTAGSANGTAVTVSASELVSGSQTITDNGTVDVTNLASVTVNVSGGSSGMNVATATATPSTASRTISFTGLSGEPTSFHIVCQEDLATASQVKVAAVAYDGTDHIGQTVTNTSNAQASYDDGFSHTYNNGTLTVTATTAYFQAEEYALCYTYGGNSSNIGTADVQVGSGATSITFTGLSDEPNCWSCIFKSNFSTSSGYQRVIAVANDGTDTFGMEMDSSAHYSDTHWTATYSNGSLTITSQGTNAGGYFHQPGYYQLTYGIGGEVEPPTIEPLTVTQNGTYQESGKAYSPVTVNVSGGGSWTVKQTTWSNNSTSTVSHQFTGLSGTPKAAVLRCTSQLTRSSSNTYYYITDIIWDGTDAWGNYHLRSNGTFNNVAKDAASGFNVSTGTNSITFSSDATSRSSAPGSFYNGTYELTYWY